jgi:hypothetical protein
LFAAETDHFRETLELGQAREPSRQDIARVSATWAQVELDLRLVPRFGNETLFERADRIGRLYDRLVRRVGITR